MAARRSSARRRWVLIDGKLVLTYCAVKLAFLAEEVRSYRQRIQQSGTRTTRDVGRCFLARNRPGLALGCPIELVGLGSRPAQSFPYRAGLAQKFAVSFDLGLDDAHRAFELGEGTGYLEQQLARRGRGIDRLLVEVEIDANRLEMLDRAKQVDQRSAKPVNRPRLDDIELALAGILGQAIEAWPLIPSLSAANAGIAVDLGHLPAAALGDLPELANLVLNRLVVVDA